MRRKSEVLSDIYGVAKEIEAVTTEVPLNVCFFIPEENARWQTMPKSRIQRCI